MEHTSRVATDVGQPDDLLAAASSSSQPATGDTKLAKSRRKTATAADACCVKASKSRRRCGFAGTSQTASESGRKQRWNALVRKSARLTLSTDDDVAGGVVVATGANGTQSRENETTTAACSTQPSRTTDAAACGFASTSSSVSPQSRFGVGSSCRTEADAHSSCRHGRDCRSPSSSSSLSSTSSTTSISSPSSTKRRRLHVDRSATNCGRCRDSCRFDCPQRCCRCCHLRLRHICRSRRCCSTCRRERRRCYDDSRRPSRYATAEPSYWQSVRQSSLVGAMSAERCMFPRACCNAISCIHQTPNCHARSAAPDSTPYTKHESPADLLDAAVVDAASCHLPTVKTSSSFATQSNNAVDDARSSSTERDRSFPTTRQLCLLPLEPVSGAALSADPRRPRQRQIATSCTTTSADVDELQTTAQTSTSKVK